MLPAWLLRLFHRRQRLAERLQSPTLPAAVAAARAELESLATTRRCPDCRGSGRGPRTDSLTRPLCRRCHGAGAVDR